jgi:hypothetical protein
LIELGGDSAASNYTVRTTTYEIQPNSGGQASNIVECQPGATAISGGSRSLLDGDQTGISNVHYDIGSGPLGSPPTGWVDYFSWEHSLSDQAVETWVICVE